MNDKRTDRSPGPHADELRRQIDSGRSGDKVAAEDPAAVPLGTDDEAAGQPPTAEQVRDSLERERREVHAGPKKGGPKTWITLAVAAVVLLILLLVLANSIA